jgi:dethiobiotin synthetase
MRGLFVTGTDTGAGKSVLSAALVAAMAAAGEPVRAYKPVLTGLDEPPDHAWPRDHELLGAASRQLPELVAPLRFGPAVSPHLAAELADTPIALERLLAAAGTLAADGTLVVEGVGGLLVPLSREASVADLAVALALPLVIAARAGLGTINHTLLTIEAARARGLHVAAVVLTPWPQEPELIERSNRETIAELGRVEVAVLQTLDGPETATLALAGALLAWRDWLG